MTDLDSRPRAHLAPTAPAPPGWQGIVAGLVAALTGLAAGELVAGLSNRLRSPVIAVGDRVVDRVPAGLKSWAIDTFGTSDKQVLKVGIVVVVLVAAVVAGVAALRGSRRGALMAVAVFGVLGAVAAMFARTGFDAAQAIPALAAASVAGGALVLLASLTSHGPATTPTTSIAPTTMAAASRRRFLVGAGALGAGAVAMGGIGRMLQHRARVAADRAAVVLGLPRRPLPVPPDPAVEMQGMSSLFTPNSGFYRIDTALVTPQVSLSSWRLSVKGRVARELSLTYDDLMARELVESDVTLSCVSNEVGGDLVGNARWLGVRLDHLLAEAGVDPSADQVVGRSVDGFTAGFPTSVLDGRDALVAVGMNGEPLPVAHGFPARLVVPGLYGYVSATKWLASIELTRFDEFEGYWIPRGWSALGPIKTQSRIDTPRALAGLSAQTQAVAGVAWAGERGIAKVEVRVDDEPWREANLGPELAATSWRQWWVPWDATPGKHRLTVRATDGTGATQVEQPTPVAPDGATGWHTITVTVR